MFAYGKYTEKWIIELKDTPGLMVTTTVTSELCIILCPRPFLLDEPQRECGSEKLLQPHMTYTHTHTHTRTNTHARTHTHEHTRTREHARAPLVDCTV